jgi:hypothetical protein
MIEEETPTCWRWPQYKHTLYEGGGDSWLAAVGLWIHMFSLAELMFILAAVGHLPCAHSTN